MKSLVLKTAVVLSSLVITAFAFMAFVAPEQAQACRDCPFPMRIGEGRWIMPNEKIEVQIERIDLPSRFEEIHVVLMDPDTHEILARGVSKQKRGRKTANIQLFDKSGREVTGFVRFVNEEREEIQARFTCEECEIEKRLRF